MPCGSFLVVSRGAQEASSKQVYARHLRLTTTSGGFGFVFEDFRTEGAHQLYLTKSLVLQLRSSVPVHVQNGYITWSGIPPRFVTLYLALCYVYDWH